MNSGPKAFTRYTRSHADLPEKRVSLPALNKKLAPSPRGSSSRTHAINFTHNRRRHSVQVSGETETRVLPESSDALYEKKKCKKQRKEKDEGGWKETYGLTSYLMGRPGTLSCPVVLSRWICVLVLRVYFHLWLTGFSRMSLRDPGTAQALRTGFLASVVCFLSVTFQSEWGNAGAPPQSRPRTELYTVDVRRVRERARGPQRSGSSTRRVRVDRREGHHCGRRGKC